MRLLAASIFIAFAIVSALGQDPRDPTPNSAQSQKPAVTAEVDLELKQTASDYKLGKFAEAQAHAERAVLLEPTNKTAALYLARVRHQRYRPYDDTRQNLEIAQAAIDAYLWVLTLDPEDEEAYKAIGVLYAATHQDELLRGWILRRAMNAQLSNEKRAEAYTILAGKDWDCSYKLTELPANKTTDRENVVMVYQRPKDPAQLETIRQCVGTGLEMADAALLLNSKSESAWSFKTALLREGAKLAEMDGMDLLKANREQEAKEAGEQAAKLAEERRQKAEPQIQYGLETLPRPLPPPANPRKPLS